MGKSLHRYAALHLDKRESESRMTLISIEALRNKPEYAHIVSDYDATPDRLGSRPMVYVREFDFVIAPMSTDKRAVL
jgi:hypothetical protein